MRLNTEMLRCGKGLGFDSTFLQTRSCLIRGCWHNTHDYQDKTVLFVAQKNPDYDNSQCLWPLEFHTITPKNTLAGCLHQKWTIAINRSDIAIHCFCGGLSKSPLWNKGCDTGLYHSRLLAEITTIGNDPGTPGLTTQLRNIRATTTLSPPTNARKRHYKIYSVHQSCYFSTKCYARW